MEQLNPCRLGMCLKTGGTDASTSEVILTPVITFSAWYRLCSVFSLFLCEPHLSFLPTLSPSLGPAALPFLPCHICHRRSVARVALGFKFNLVSIWCNCFERQPWLRVFPVFCDTESSPPFSRSSHCCGTTVHHT